MDNLVDNTLPQARWAQKTRAKKMAKQILREAKIVARWKKTPFYIS